MTFQRDSFCSFLVKKSKTAIIGFPVVLLQAAIRRSIAYI